MNKDTQLQVVNILYPELQEILLQYIPKDIINNIIVPMLCPNNPFSENNLRHISKIQYGVFIPPPLGCFFGNERNNDDKKEKELDFWINRLKEDTTEPYFLTHGSYEHSQEFKEEFKTLLNKRGYYPVVHAFDFGNWRDKVFHTIICPLSHKNLFEEKGKLLLKTYYHAHNKYFFPDLNNNMNNEIK